MLDWIFEGIANWIASIVTQLMDAISGIFLNALGTDMTAMEEYFPFVTKAFQIFQYFAWAPIQSLRVNVTHYCPCSKCCGKWAGGPTASGKMPQPGIVAMSSHYPFGTLIEIGGVMYTVEDRGGSGIENDITRVDIFVRSHQEALRLGRFDADAKIYRLGR